MTDLIKRLESAEAGSRELDAEMYLRFGWSGNAPHEVALNTSAEWLDFHGWNVTADLSAAIALVERVLPGHSFMFSRSSDGSNFAEFGRGPDGVLIEDAMCDGDITPVTLPLAICIALLKALEAKEHV